MDGEIQKEIEEDQELSNWVTENTMAADWIQTRDAVVEKPICTFLGEKLPPKTLLPDGWKKMEAEKPSMSFKFQK